MAESEVLNVYDSKIKEGRYNLKIKSIETYWPGYGSGKIEDMPRDFLETQVFMKNISGKPSHLESLAIQNKVILWENKKEITQKHDGYAKETHDHMVKKIKENPSIYLKSIPATIKEIL